MRLTEEQLHQLHRARIGLHHIHDATTRLNSLLSDLAGEGLPLRLLPEFFLQQTAQDITTSIHNHELADDAARLERMVA